MACVDKGFDVAHAALYGGVALSAAISARQVYEGGLSYFGGDYGDLRANALYAGVWAGSALFSACLLPISNIVRNSLLGASAGGSSTPTELG